MAYTDIDDPSAYFQTRIFTGNENTLAVTFDGNSDLQPDWVWIKNRADNYNHSLFDSVRGVTKRIATNNDAIEATVAASLTAFNSNGFSLGNDTTANADGDSHVSWNWKAGTSVSGNTSGSGTAKAYTGSVNTDAGFSIIRHLGNDTAGHTIPHHLGAVPKMIIGHGISGSDTTSWTVYHHSLGNTHTISLNEQGAAADSSVWNDTTPTSSVISLGSSGNVNDADDAFILYSFAEKQGYSKFDSYIGNGASDDGTVVYTGFKPAFIMYKNSAAGSTDWYMYDNKRGGPAAGVYGNNNKYFLRANLNNTEGNESLHVFSNGFQIRVSNSFANSNGVKYIYMAFAENPFTTSTGIPTTAR